MAKIKVSQEYLDSLKDMLVEGAKEPIDKYALSVAQETKSIYKDKYMEFIETFYEYETLVYVRHGQTRTGTGTGVNLYRSFNAHISRSGKLPSKMIVELNTSRMETDYYSFSGKPYSADSILNNVLNDYRSRSDAAHNYLDIPWDVGGYSYKINRKSIVGRKFSDVISPQDMDDALKELGSICETYYREMMQYAIKRGIKDTAMLLGITK